MSELSGGPRAGAQDDFFCVSALRERKALPAIPGAKADELDDKPGIL